MNSNIIVEHASGTAVRLKIPINGLLKIRPSVLLGYRTDHVLTLADREYVCSRSILCMPVCRSPLLCRNEWNTKYTDSLTILSMLRTIISCYSIDPECNFYMLYKDRIDVSTDTMKKAVITLDTQLFTELDKFYKTYDKPTEEACVSLVHMLERYTLQLINIFERCIHGMFIPEIPVQHILTPHLTPNLNELVPDQQKKVFVGLDALFEVKDQIQNVRLELAGHKPRQYFKPIIANSNIKFKNYLEQQRIIEYFAFLNINKND